MLEVIDVVCIIVSQDENVYLVEKFSGLGGIGIYFVK